MQNLLSIGYMNSETYLFPAHQHPYWEISYYTYGEGITTIGSQKITFQPGTIICQPPFVPHSEFAEKGYRNIYFSIETFDSPSHAIPVFADNENKLIHSLLMQLHTEFHMRRKNWKSICEGLLHTAYQYMISFTTCTTKNTYVEALEKMLVANLSNRNISLQKIMNDMPLSKDHVRRLFIKETGRTPTQYLTEKRVNNAKQLIETRLEYGGISFKEIAFLSGFDDPYYFSRTFKKVTGKSPTEWYQHTIK